MADLWASQPKHLRAIWGNVNGERMWYAIHGYDLHAMPTSRGMFGHGRVLPPNWRGIDQARGCSRLLLTKAARRMRRDGFNAGHLGLWLSIRNGGWSGGRSLHGVQDDQACLRGLDALWEEARNEIARNAKIIRVGVFLSDLTASNQRQLDMFLDDDTDRQRCEVLTNTIDRLNHQFGSYLATAARALDAWFLRVWRNAEQIRLSRVKHDLEATLPKHVPQVVDFASENGAGERIRTVDPNLGKVTVMVPGALGSLCGS